VNVQFEQPDILTLIVAVPPSKSMPCQDKKFLDVAVVIKDVFCLGPLLRAAGVGAGSTTNAFGITVTNCTAINNALGGVLAYSTVAGAVTVRNCVLVGGTALESGGSSTNITEDFNRLYSTTPRAAVATGANSITGYHALETFNRPMSGLPFSYLGATSYLGAAYNSGSPTGAPTFDMFTTNWTGANPDRGAISNTNVSSITNYVPTERNASTIRIAPGSTSQSIELYLGVTGLTASTAGLSARYNRTRTASVNIPLVARTIGQAWISGGFAEVDSVYMPGVYRLDLPDAALAAAADDVTVVVRGASGTNGAVMTVTLSTGDNTGAGDVSGNILEITEDPQEVTNISAWTGDWHTYVMRLVDDNGTPYDTTNDTLSVTYTNVATGSAYSFNSGSATITKQLNGQGIISLLNPAAYPTAAVIRITIGAAIGSTVRRFGPLEVEVLAP